VDTVTFLVMRVYLSNILSAYPAPI